MVSEFQHKGGQRGVWDACKNFLIVLQMRRLRNIGVKSEPEGWVGDHSTRRSYEGRGLNTKAYRETGIQITRKITEEYLRRSTESINRFKHKEHRKALEITEDLSYQTTLTCRQRSSSQLLLNSTGNELNKLHLTGAAGRLHPSAWWTTPHLDRDIWWNSLERRNNRKQTDRKKQKNKDKQPRLLTHWRSSTHFDCIKLWKKS